MRAGRAAGSVWLTVVTVVLVLGAGALVVLAAIHTSDESSAAKSERSRYYSQIGLVSIIGDSYSSGSEEDSGRESLWWNRLATELTFRTQVLAVGGSGYVAVSPEDKAAGTFLNRANEVAKNARAVLVFGSRNDEPPSAQPSEVGQAASAVIAEVRRRAPGARIVMIGPPWTGDNPPNWLVSDRDAIRAEANQAGVEFLDPIAGKWFWDTHGLIGSDGIHPNDAGHAYMADRMRSVVLQAVTIR